MLSDRPVLTLREHLKAFLADEKHPEQALATVHRIARQTSEHEQIPYMEKVLTAIQDKSPVERVNAEQWLHKLTNAYEGFKHAEVLLNLSRKKSRFISTQSAKEMYELCLYQFELAKSRLSTLRADVYDYLENKGTPIIIKSPIAAGCWWNAVQDIASHSIIVNDSTTGRKRAIRTSLLDRPVKNYTPDLTNPGSKAALSQVLSRDMNDYLFVKEKGKGFNRPGVYGGEYVCCYTVPGAHGDEIQVQRLLIKQDTTRAVIHHEKNIAEFVGSEILNELVPTDDAASVFYLRASWDPKGKDLSTQGIDEAGESVYVASAFFDKYTDLYEDIFERNKLPALKSFYIRAAEIIQNLQAFSSAYGVGDEKDILDAVSKLSGLPALVAKKRSELDDMLVAIQAGNDETVDLGFDPAKQKKYEIGQIYIYLESLQSKLKGNPQAKNIFSGLSVLQQEYRKIIEESDKERPKFLNSPGLEQLKKIFPFIGRFSAIFNKNILEKNIKPDSSVSNCTYDNYASLTVGSVLIQDFDTHIENFGAVPGKTNRKALKRIDFGAAFKKFSEEVHIHSRSRHPFGLGPVNHIRDWPLELRTNTTFINELKKQANHPYDKLCAAIDRVMNKTEEFYGMAPLEEFARHVGLNVKKLRKNKNYDRTRLSKAIRGHLKEVIWCRQISTKILALEFEKSLYADRDPVFGQIKPNPKLDELIKQNPNYFLRGHFHFRHRRNKGKFSSYPSAMRSYVRSVLEKSDGFCPIIKKDFTFDDKSLRAEILLTRLKLMIQFETDADRKKQLQQNVEFLLRGIKKYHRERGRIANLRNDTSTRFLVSLCDTSYNAIKTSYEALSLDSAKKAQIELAMDGGEGLDLSRSKHVKKYCERLQKNLTEGVSGRRSFLPAQSSPPVVNSTTASTPVTTKNIPSAPAPVPANPIQVEPVPEYNFTVVAETHKKLLESTSAAVKSTTSVLESIVTILVILADAESKLGKTDAAKKALEKYGFFHPEMVERVKQQAGSGKSWCPPSTRTP